MFFVFTWVDWILRVWGALLTFVCTGCQGWGGQKLVRTKGVSETVSEGGYGVCKTIFWDVGIEGGPVKISPLSFYGASWLA